MRPNVFFSLLSVREKEAKEPEPFLRPAELITLAISLIALAASGYSTYLQYFRHDPGLSIGWTRRDGDTMDMENDANDQPIEFRATFPTTLSLVNTGNVPLLIQRITFLGNTQFNTSCQEKPKGGMFEGSIGPEWLTKALPLISKAGDITTVPFEFSAAISVGGVVDGAARRASFEKGKKYGVTFCVTFTIYDPKGKKWEIVIPNIQFTPTVLENGVGTVSSRVDGDLHKLF